MDVVSTADARQKVSDIKVQGNPDIWQLLCKAGSESQGWMKSTKAMFIEGWGSVLQATTLQNGVPAEALAELPGAKVVSDGSGGLRMIAMSPDELIYKGPCPVAYQSPAVERATPPRAMVRDGDVDLRPGIHGR